MMKMIIVMMIILTFLYNYSLGNGFKNGFTPQIHKDKATDSNLLEKGKGSGIRRQIYIIIGLKIN